MIVPILLFVDGRPGSASLHRLLGYFQNTQTTHVLNIICHILLSINIRFTNGFSVSDEISPYLFYTYYFFGITKKIDIIQRPRSDKYLYRLVRASKKNVSRYTTVGLKTLALV